MQGRLAPSPAIGDLGRSEEPLFKTWVTGQSPAEPFDLDQVETNESFAPAWMAVACAPSPSRGRPHDYSTVTVLARLRG